MGLGIKQRFMQLSKVGKVAVVAGSGMALLTVAGVSADDTITTKTETVKQSVAYATEYQDDESKLSTEQSIVVEGVNGEREVTYDVTLRNGVEDSREEQSSRMLTKPVNQIIVRGIRTTGSIQENSTIPFKTTTTSDAAMEQGQTKVVTSGVNGTKTTTYETTLLRGAELSRKVIKEEVTINPVDEVKAIGTKPKVSASSCDPNYSGCVPIASDVDCAGGSGNGPAYVRGPIRVIGYDIYDLDRDGDKIACQS